MNRLALKGQVDSPYVVWLSLRQAIVDCGHSGHFTRENAYQQTIKFGLNFSRRTFNRIILQGRDIFWGTDTERIYIRSFAKVYSKLADDSARLNRNPKMVEIELHKSLANRRAELYWSWFMAKGETTIARDSLKELFGLSHDQQRAYEALLQNRLKIHSNYCHIDADLYQHKLTNLPAHHFEFKQEKFTDNTITTVNVVAYQLPNTYFPRSSKRGESPLAKTSRRNLRASRTLYRDTNLVANEKRYFDFWDEFGAMESPNQYIRTYYQGTKHIYRQSQYF